MEKSDRISDDKVQNGYSLTLLKGSKPARDAYTISRDLFQMGVRCIEIYIQQDS